MRSIFKANISQSPQSEAKLDFLIKGYNEGDTFIEWAHEGYRENEKSQEESDSICKNGGYQQQDGGYLMEDQESQYSPYSSAQLSEKIANRKNKEGKDMVDKRNNYKNKQQYKYISKLNSATDNSLDNLQCTHQTAYQYICENCEILLCKNCKMNAHDQTHHFIGLSNMLDCVIKKLGHHVYRKSLTKRQQIPEINETSHQLSKSTSKLLSPMRKSLSSSKISSLHKKNQSCSTNLICEEQICCSTVSHTYKPVLNKNLQNLDEIQTKIKALKYQKYQLSAKNHRLQEYLSMLVKEYSKRIKQAKDILDQCQRNVNQIIFKWQDQSSEQMRIKINEVQDNIEYIQYMRDILSQKIDSNDCNWKVNGQNIILDNSYHQRQQSTSMTQCEYFFSKYIINNSKFDDGIHRWHKYQSKIIDQYRNGCYQRQDDNQGVQKNVDIIGSIVKQINGNVFNAGISRIQRQVVISEDLLLMSRTGKYCNRVRRQTEQTELMSCILNDRGVGNSEESKDTKSKYIKKIQQQNILNKQQDRNKIMRDISVRLRQYRNRKDASNNNKNGDTKIGMKGTQIAKQKRECINVWAIYGGYKNMGQSLVDIYMPVEMDQKLRKQGRIISKLNNKQVNKTFKVKLKDKQNHKQTKDKVKLSRHPNRSTLKDGLSDITDIKNNVLNQQKPQFANDQTSKQSKINKNAMGHRLEKTKDKTILQHTNCGIIQIKNNDKYEIYTFAGMLNNQVLTNCIFKVSPLQNKRQIVGSIRQPLIKFGYTYVPISKKINTNIKKTELSISKSLEQQLLGKLYICGGVNEDQQVQSSFTIYNMLKQTDGQDIKIEQEKCEQHLYMDYRRYEHTLTYYKGFLYVIGGRIYSDEIAQRCEQNSGQKQDKPTSLVQKFKIKEGQGKNYKGNTYEKLFLTQPRTNHQIVIVDSGLYVVGGNNGSNYIREIEKYDLEKGIFVGVMDISYPGRYLSVMPFQNFNNRDTIVILGSQTDQKYGERNINGQVIDLIDRKSEIVQYRKTEIFQLCSLEYKICPICIDQI